jgi:hypothetical protein
MHAQTKPSFKAVSKSMFSSSCTPIKRHRHVPFQHPQAICVPFAFAFNFNSTPFAPMSRPPAHFGRPTLKTDPAQMSMHDQAGILHIWDI